MINQLFVDVQMGRLWQQLLLCSQSAIAMKYQGG